uniref:Threonine--tRNA ligase n=2 Tax=Candidatus Giovannoniibacteriota TaxID=1752738 RepID=A0A0G0ZJV8_9BACT|nr:MAG: Threonine-tRNA ligase [Candidatus Giovannonibacteria bacterium GW2011_GWF2_42_19]
MQNFAAPRDNKKTQSNNIESVRHSLAHLLAAAVLKKFPTAKLGIGPNIEDGFYYDFKLPKPISDSDLAEFEKTIRNFISQKLDFSGEKITPLKAKKLFKAQPFKLELIKDFTKEKKGLTSYSTGRIFVDLCRGGHVQNTSEINPGSFKLTKIAGAYWKGSEKNAQLTRIYGVAFQTKEELDSHLKALEEAKKRDHKKLGQELDLFTFSDLVGAGLPLWTPKGTLLRDILDDFVWQLRNEKGYERVDIPHITKKELYEKSGHWDKFKDELFIIETREGHIFAMKPMNCPHHTQIYARKQWSYRELPQRYASTTKVYRDEQTGELAGLLRVRAITQDDAHVFCRPSQVKEEIFKIWDIISEFYGKFGFELSVRLSLHDPRHQEKYLGTEKLWKESESVLRELVGARGIRAEEAPGEAALYGPKIDFMGKDALGRMHQVATIQLDMNLPERFDLFCINEKGERERVVMIHAAIMGSIERFLSVIIEHFAGAFPFWLSPVQVQILTVTDRAINYANEILGNLKSNNIRVATDFRNESIGKKIREAELQKIPFILIIGDKEVDAKKIAVRERGKGDLGQKTFEEFLDIAK